MTRRLGELQGRSGRIRKIPPTAIRSPDCSADSESLYRLSYRDPHKNQHVTDIFSMLISAFTPPASIAVSIHSQMVTQNWTYVWNYAIHESPCIVWASDKARNSRRCSLPSSLPSASASSNSSSSSSSSNSSSSSRLHRQNESACRRAQRDAATTNVPKQTATVPVCASWYDNERSGELVSLRAIGFRPGAEPF